MMLQVFADGEKRAARFRRSQLEFEDGVIAGAAATSDDVSTRLERELAVVLSRKPRHRLPIVGTDDADDDETPIQFEANGDNSEDADPFQTDDSLAVNIVAKTKADETSEVGAPRPASTGAAERWKQSTRFNRRSGIFRQSASVVITLAVTSFIISIVAVILFGVPNGVRKFTASSERSALITTRTVGTVPVTLNTVPATAEGASK